MHEEIRSQMNSSIMALLAGSRLAVHLLRLTEGSERTLGEVFPRIRDIRRFDLKTSRASGILEAAESHLGYMAIPYILGIHEDYMKTCLRLVAAHRTTVDRVDRIKAYRQHLVLQQGSPVRFASASLEQYHLLRLMRNCLVHARGEVDSELRRHASGMSARARQGWERLTHLPFSSPAEGDFLIISQAETIAALAVTKSLARRANEILQAVIPVVAWLEVLVSDLVLHGGAIPRNPSERRRKLRGYARHYYGTLSLTEEDLERAEGLLENEVGELPRGATPQLKEADLDT